MWKTLRSLAFAAAVALPTAAGACAPTEGVNVDLHGQKVRLTIIHTSDIHSRLFPYEYTPLLPDKAAGLQVGKGPYGGMAKLTYVIKRERARADRSIHIDGGDISQGAPIYNYFSGEAEFRALAETGVDAMVIANHEFDRGATNVTQQLKKWATFPVLAANYMLDDPSFPGDQLLSTVLKPYTKLNVRGLRVGVIGMGNLSTITSIFQMPNSLGITPLKTRDVAQFYIDFLRPQVDLIVVVTHLGLEVDQELIQETEGIDVVLGGHNHIVVSPPKEVFDCGGVDADQGFVQIPDADGNLQKRYCKPRKVLLMHSGAFAKFVGRLDVDVTDDAKQVNDAYGRDVYDPVNGFEVVSHQQNLFPIDVDVPADADMTKLLEPYEQALKNLGKLDLLVGYAPADVKRTAPNGGDSQLGNLIATSMWLRLGVQTDFSMTNTTGIRADIPKGPVTIEEMFNVFPFDNSITKMQLSGDEVLEMMDFAARRSQSRACTSQIQIAGAFVAMNCNGCDPAFRPDVQPGVAACAEQVFIGYDTGRACKQDTDCLADPKLSRFHCDKNVGLCRTQVTKSSSYDFATSNYLAGGGSGFRVLQRNTTQFDTKIQQRDAVTDFVRVAKPCGWQKLPDGTQGLPSCSTDKDCAAYGDFVCACPESSSVLPQPPGNPLSCQTQAGVACAPGAGQCVLTSCRDDLADFHNRENCVGTSGDGQTKCQATACSQAGEQCKILACIDPGVGAVVDGRQIMLGR